LRQGRCSTNAGSWLFGYLAESLHPDMAGDQERARLRALVSESPHETRAELARLVGALASRDLYEAEILEAIRPQCSTELGKIVDAVTGYERFAALVDAAFRTLCAVSYALGNQPLTPANTAQHPIIQRCARELPDAYQVAVQHMAEMNADEGMETRLGEFAIGRGPAELVELLLTHHQAVQAAKPPSGKRAWFEPLRDGWVVRPAYASAQQPELGSWFVHPVRIAALSRFLEDTA
jgi:hypothetical protein